MQSGLARWPKRRTSLSPGTSTRSTITSGDGSLLAGSAQVQTSPMRCCFSRRPPQPTSPEPSCMSMEAASPLGKQMTAPGAVVDLTLEFQQGMPVVAPWPAPLVLPFATHESSRHEGLGAEDDVFTYAATYVSTLDHAGTHVDAPYHFDLKGATIDMSPLGWFAGKAVCLDVSSVGDRGRSRGDEGAGRRDRRGRIHRRRADR